MEFPYDDGLEYDPDRGRNRQRAAEVEHYWERRREVERHYPAGDYDPNFRDWLQANPPPGDTPEAALWRTVLKFCAFIFVAMLLAQLAHINEYVALCLLIVARLAWSHYRATKHYLGWLGFDSKKALRSACDERQKRLGPGTYDALKQRALAELRDAAGKGAPEPDAEGTAEFEFALHAAAYGSGLGVCLRRPGRDGAELDAHCEDRIHARARHFLNRHHHAAEEAVAEAKAKAERWPRPIRAVIWVGVLGVPLMMFGDGLPALHLQEFGALAFVAGAATLVGYLAWRTVKAVAAFVWAIITVPVRIVRWVASLGQRAQ